MMLCYTKGNITPQWWRLEKKRQCRRKNSPRNRSNSAVRKPDEQASFSSSTKHGGNDLRASVARWLITDCSHFGSNLQAQQLHSWQKPSLTPWCVCFWNALLLSNNTFLQTMTPARPRIKHESRAGEWTLAAVQVLPQFLSTTEDVGLKLQQLAHEGQVGGDDLTSLLYEVKGLVQFDALRVHQVSQADGGRAGDTCLTVYQHSASALLHRVCKRRQDGARDQQSKRGSISALSPRREIQL